MAKKRKRQRKRLTDTKPSCVQLLDSLDKLTVVVPAMVVREVQANLESSYQLGQEFFRLLASAPPITILWADPPQELIEEHMALGFAEEDAAIAAAAKYVGANM